MHEHSVHRPGQFRGATNLGPIAIGEIDAQQFPARNGKNAIVIHGRAARLELMVDHAAQFQGSSPQIDQLHL